MTSGADEEMVAFRLGSRDRAAIKRLVDDGEFRNRSEFLRDAVKTSLRGYEKHTASAKLDLDLEQVELPSSHEPSSARAARAGRSSRGHSR
ncbi:MAG: ribbon-helix-helix domain-containing protein [Candidatus Thermoplasmatota archaeon]